MLLLFSSKFWAFYGEYQQAEQLDSPLKVMYSNIYKDNPHYEELLKQIEDENADILLFVEFKPHHKANLQPLLQQKYPYMIKASDSTSFIASKYPLTKLSTSLEDEKWKYYYFKVEKTDQNYYFYLVHTSSPTSQDHFFNRNRQLERLSQDFLSFQSQERPANAKIVMLGDFNISPRSLYYEQFAKKLEGKLENATRSFPMYFSRDLAKLLEISGTIKGVPSLLWSHIDQLFISPSVKMNALKAIQVLGSDHRGFSFKVE